MWWCCGSCYCGGPGWNLSCCVHSSHRTTAASAERKKRTTWVFC